MTMRIRSLLFVGMLGALVSCSADDAQVPSGTRDVSLPTSADELPADVGTRPGGADWPTFLGPERNGKSAETGILTTWPAEGLRIVWQRELGESYGIGSVSRGRYLQFDRFGAQARLTCLHAETGVTLWEFNYPTSYQDMYGYNGGPRCSPVVDGDRVYILGVEGMLHCLRLADGAVRWTCDTARQFGVVQNFFGVGSTPLIEGDLLIAVIGGSPESEQRLAPGQLNRLSGNGTGLVAFDKYTGAVRYAVTDELAGYAAPITATIGDRRWCFAFCRGGLVGFEPQSGRVDFAYAWRASLLESVNAATPVVVGNEVFISETYGPGSSLLRVKPGSYEIVWRDDPQRRQKSMKMHWNTPIFHEGFLYGCSGRNSPDAQLRCVEWQTGAVRWTFPTAAHIALLYADGHFLGLEERGKLILFKANPERYEPRAEFEPRAAGAAASADGIPPPRLLQFPCWAAPILSHGLLYVRGRDRLICFELIPTR
ncbi:MAG: PQQ-binding-like beta-propeller repeat protein [Pirellulaceae bacterium]